MTSRTLNRRFLELQALVTLTECVSVVFLSPILVSFGYSPRQIGWVMALGALAAALARPVWGIANDRFSCSRQLLAGAIAAGAACYSLLIGGGGRPAVTVLAAMGMQVTIICMLSFADAWALRLIRGGAQLDYGGTRAGGSVSYAVGAVVFGAVSARWGYRPGVFILWALTAVVCVVAFSLPNPTSAGGADGTDVRVREGFRLLFSIRPYRVMLGAFFLCTLASCAMESFYSVQILQMGGTERHVGAALFMQAMCELPVMIGYGRIRRRTGLTPAQLMSISMAGYALKALVLGFAGSVPVAMGAALLQIVSFGLFTPACVDFMLETVPEKYLSTAHLVFLALGQGAASVIGNAAAGQLAERMGVGAMFRLASLLALAAGILAWRLTAEKGRSKA